MAVNCLARFAVPLFFLSAGFFSWRSPPRVLARRTVRTAGLLLFACLALLGLGCAMARHGGASMGAYLLGRFTWANAASLVLWQLFPLPYSWPLWFLAALLMIYLMWWGLTALLRGRLPHRLLAVLALGLLAASGQIPVEALQGRIFAGELSLSGALKPVPGMLPLAIMARQQGLTSVILPPDNLSLIHI